MSVRIGDPGHFDRWLISRYASIGGAAPEFAPRSIYGEYLSAVGDESVVRLREKGWDVDVIPLAVTGSRRGEDSISLSSGSLLYGPFDCVIVAVGVGRPDDIFGLQDAVNFVHDPYPIAEKLSGIGSGDAVAVVGSGLTAVDTVLALDARGHRGRITLLSRRGILPAVRQRPIEYEPEHFVPARLHALAGEDKKLELSEVLDLLRLEFEESGARFDDVLVEITGRDREEPLRRLQRQIDAVDSDHIGLRILQTAVPVCGPDLWPLLADEVKREVLETHYRTLMSLCCPMPLSSARTLSRLMRAGRLEVMHGTIDITATAAGDFVINPPSASFRADHVVNCVSAPRHRIPDAAQSLVNSLVEQGLALLHADGGLCVRTDNSLCNNNGPRGYRRHPRLYAIGDITGGTFFFTFGIPSLVDRCRDIVMDLLMVGRVDERRESYV